METIAIPLLLVVGGLLAVQAAANVQLATAMGSPAAAATLQLAIGAALLLALTLVSGAAGALWLARGLPAWQLVGGLASALYITAGIVCFPRLGAVTTVGMFITGQMLASLLLDGTGALGVHRKPVTAVTVVGVAAVLAGAALIVRSQRRAGATLGLPGRAAWLMLTVAAGAGLPVQGAINAQLRAGLHAPVAAGALSFVVATAAMALVLLASLALLRAPGPRVEPLRRVPWWGWVGGIIGASYVVSVFLMIPVIGAAPTVALTVAGQQLASVLVDRAGALRLPARPITRARLAGVAVLLAGVALLQVVA